MSRGRGARTAAALVAIGLATLCVRLGFWQLSRLEEKRALNRRMRASLAAAVERVTADTPIDSMVGRRVLVIGEYDSLWHVVLRGRANHGAPGVELLTPLRRAGGEAVLVSRGWLPSPDAATVHPETVNEPGTVRVLGVVESVPASSGRARLVVTRAAPGPTLLTLNRLAIDSVRALLPYPIAASMIRQLPDSGLARFPVRRAPEPYNERMHFSYAFQWFFFAAVLLLAAFFIMMQADPARPKPPG